MPSSVSFTESQNESQTESQSSRGPHITQWLPQLVLAALLSVAAASIIGLSLSAVAFSNPEELTKRGHGIAQSFVMFASMCSLLYLPLHLVACRKGEDLYIDAPIPSFRHKLHAWASLVIQITVVMWASAAIPVAVGIHRGPDARSTVFLKADIFACATGFLFSSLVLTVVQLAHRPFTLPLLSPPAFEETASASARDFDSLKFEKKSSASDSSTAGTLRSSPPRTRRYKAPSAATSRSSSTARSRGTTQARKMTRTRRYVLEIPSPSASPPPPLPLPMPLARKRTGSGSSSDDSTVDPFPVPSPSASSDTSTRGSDTPPTSACASSAGAGAGVATSEAAASTADATEAEAGSHGNTRLLCRVGDEVVSSSDGQDSVCVVPRAADDAGEGKAPREGKGRVVVAVVEVGDEPPATPRGKAGVGTRRRGKGFGSRAAGAAGAGAVESPSLFRFRRRNAPKSEKGGGSGEGDGGGKTSGKGGVEPPAAAAPAPPPPLPPSSPPSAPMYWVPGAWVPRKQAGEDTGED